MGDAVSSNQDSVRPNWVVAFIHGIGAFRAEEMSRDAAQAIEGVRRGFGTPLSDTTHRFDDGQSIRVTESQVGATRMRMAEAYWGDISRVRESWTGLLIGATSTFLRLRALIEAASAVGEPPAPLIGRLLQLTTWVVRMVVLPLMIVAAGLGVCGFGLDRLVGLDHLGPAQTAPYVVGAAATIGVLALLIWSRLRRATTGWEMGAPIALAVLAMSFLTAGIAAVDGWLRPGWIKGRLCTETGCYSAAKLEPTVAQSLPQPPYGLHIAMNVKLQDIALGVALVALSVAILLVKYVERGGAPRGIVRSLRIAATATVTFFVFYFLLTKPIDVLSGFYLGNGARSFSLYWPDWFVLGFLVAVAMLVLATMSARSVWFRARSSRNSSFRSAPFDEEAPARLILMQRYETLALGFALLMTATALGVELWKHLPGGGESIIRPRNVPSISIVAALLLVLGVSLWLSPTLKTALAIVMDVVDHFYVPSHGTPVSVLRRRRLERVLDLLLENCDRTNLLIVAHSQGTVVALDALRDGVLERKCAGAVDRLRILTVGSPISHIYQHYFEHLYPCISIESLELDTLAGGLEWINVYRADDYVGRLIGGVQPALPLNVELPELGGHNRYWKADVFPHLDRTCPDFLPQGA